MTKIIVNSNIELPSFPIFILLCSNKSGLPLLTQHPVNRCPNTVQGQLIHTRKSVDQDLTCHSLNIISNEILYRVKKTSISPIHLEMKIKLIWRPNDQMIKLEGFPYIEHLVAKGKENLKKRGREKDNG